MTMPDMTKERKDATEDIVDALYDQCKMRIERTYTQYTARITRSAAGDPQALQQQLDQLKESRSNHLDMATQLKDDVYKDIEMASAKYQADSETKKKIVESFRADACDMEYDCGEGLLGLFGMYVFN